MRQEALLEPVAELLDRTKREQSERWRGVLLHAMSNGTSIFSPSINPHFR